MHLLVKNIHSSKSVWVRIERVVDFAEVSEWLILVRQKYIYLEKM